MAAALERAGHAATVLTAGGRSGSHQRGTVTWSAAAPVASARFLAQLEQLMAGERFDHVVPLTEAAMYRLWDATPSWSERIFPRTDRDQRRLLRDKHALLEHMAGRGLEVPRQLRLDPGLASDDLVRELGLPLVVKGATGSAGTRVRIVDTRAALARAIERARALGGDWSVQTWVAGPTCLLGGMFHAGRALRLYAAEKLEQYPARTGPAIRLRSDDDAALIETGLRVFRELRWTGFASADLIRRPDGAHVLLEVNPRPWGSIAGASRAGVDLFTPFVELLAGRVPPADLSFAANHECMIFPRYLLSSRHRSFRGVAQAVRDLFGDQGRDWRQPRFLLRNLVRIHDRRREWREF